MSEGYYYRTVIIVPSKGIGTSSKTHVENCQRQTYLPKEKIVKNKPE